MRAAWWLAWRELLDRRAAFAAAVALLAAATALVAATELVARAREAAVAAQIDQMGPPLRLLPGGVTARDVARGQLSGRLLPRDLQARVGRRLGPQLRGTDGRLVVRLGVAGAGDVSVIGIDPERVISPFAELGRLQSGEAAAGSELARRIGKRAGQPVKVGQHERRLSAVLPPSASADDLALFVTLRDLQRLAALPDRVNELRLYPRTGVALEDLATSLRAEHRTLTLLVASRGETAEREMGASLARYRWMLYLAVGLAVAICVLIGAHLNAAERRRELATLVAMGGTTSTVLAAVALRAAIVGALGGALGCGLGALISIAQDAGATSAAVWSWKIPLTMCAGAVGLSVLGALPVSLASALREHVPALQE